MGNHKQSCAVGRRIATFRQAAGLTQRELAERVGWSHQSMINLELGRRGATVEKLMAVAAALNLPPAVLLIEDLALAAVVQQLASDPAVFADVQFFLNAREEEPPDIAE